MSHLAVSIEDAPLNSFHQRLTVAVGGASLMDGYILSIIGVALVQMTAQLQLSNFWQGMIATSALLGILLAAYSVVGLLINLGGEKWCLSHLSYF